MPAPLAPAAPDDPPRLPPLTLSNDSNGRVRARAERDGLTLVVCLGYARRGLADPYEVRVELPDGERLDPEQYGYVMNLLDSLCPLGIEINTSELRRNHLAAADGTPVAPLPAADASRTYHRYRRRRTVGGTDTDRTARATSDLDGRR
ncbi:hypothetical protein [Streptomyces sp. RKAG337]|uniref:hypothetical protein n=1 Tax=Streptomyces sp. RKAG337 TaxID=2893404 RepID=UPI002034414A|nr:hypothetical protein [Streptomyces sp. RKAG337]MCM2424874.1 hypothetical protein [Streptomyces sp. RKAG337]